MEYCRALSRNANTSEELFQLAKEKGAQLIVAANPTLLDMEDQKDHLRFQRRVAHLQSTKKMEWLIHCSMV